MLSAANPATAMIAATASRRTRALIGTPSPIGVFGDKPIPDASDCLDALISATRRQRLSQPQNVHVDRAVLDEDVSAPNAVEKLRAIESPLRPAHQLFQQPKFERPQAHPSAIYRTRCARVSISIEPAVIFPSAGFPVRRNRDFTRAINSFGGKGLTA